MTNMGDTVKRPGTAVIQAGLVIAMIGVMLTIVTLANGGNLNMLWVAAVGLVLAGIGFGVRVLAALERR